MTDGRRQAVALRMVSDFHRAALLSLAADALYCAGFLDAGGPDPVKREAAEFEARLALYLIGARAEGWRLVSAELGVEAEAASFENSQPGRDVLDRVGAALGALTPFTAEQVRSRRLLGAVPAEPADFAREYAGLFAACEALLCP
jgi:hypothetical protein